MTDATSQSGLGLLGQLSESVPSLFRMELDLLRAEMDEKVGAVGNGIGLLVGGVVVAMTALNILATALVAAVAASGLEPGWSALIVGVVFAVIGLLLVQQGSAHLKANRLAPRRTLRSVNRDAEMVREAL